MPYFQDPMDENEDDQGGTQVGGAAPSFGSSQPAPQGGGAAPKAKVEKTGSNFSNIDKYIQANKNQGFGGQVIGKVQGDVDKANQSMQDAAASFTNKVNANQAFGKEQVDAALADPSKADKTQFQGAMTQQYKGPRSLAESQDDFNKFTGDASKAQTAANSLSSEGGRFALLDQYFGRNNYGFGQKSLDNALFQSSPGAGQQAQAVQQQANQLQSQSKQAQDQLQAQASQRAGEIEQARNYTNQALGFDKNGQVMTGQGAFGSLQKQLADGLTSRNAERTAKQQAMQQALAAGNAQGYDLTDEQLQELGIDPGTSTYGVDFSRYVNTPGALSMDQFASDDQRARLMALNELVGDGYRQNMLGDKQAATADIEFDREKYLADVDAARTGMTSNISNLSNERQTLINNANSLQEWLNGGSIFSPRSSRGPTPQQMIAEANAKGEQLKQLQAALAAAEQRRIY